MRRLLVWLSGARAQILAECPTELPKYVGIGTAILITATMAAVSLTFALVTALKVTLVVALPFAVAWGIAILCLDRLFVVTMHRGGSWWGHIARAVPRFLLALLLGVVISTPFVLQIFRPEIQHEITLIQDQNATAYYKKLPGGPLSKEITSEQNTVATLQAEAAGTGAGTKASQNPELANLIQQREQATANANNAYKSWQCQLYGPCKPTGDGPLAKADESRYKTYQSQVVSLSTQIGQLQHQQQQADGKQEKLQSSSASAQLAGAQKVLQTDKAEQQRETADFVNGNKNDTGLLIRLQALGAATAGNSTLQAARWLLFLLFVAIDCMPVLVKIMLNLGPENNYDRLLAGEEAKQLRVAASNRAVRQAAEVLDGSTFAEESRSRVAGWGAPLPNITEEIISTRERVEMARLKAWEAEQMRRLRDGEGTMPGRQSAVPESPLAPTLSSWAREPSGRGRPWLRRRGERARDDEQAGWRSNGDSPAPGRRSTRSRRARRSQPDAVPVTHNTATSPEMPVLPRGRFQRLAEWLGWA